MSYIRSEEHAKNEREVALGLLHHDYQELYLEAEERTSDSARFAKSVDKLAPNILDLLTPPAITIQRYRHYLNIPPNRIIPTIDDYKRAYMDWNDFVSETLPGNDPTVGCPAHSVLLIQIPA